MGDEFEYIEWVRRQTRPHPHILHGPGDDCAVVLTLSASQLITTDMLMDGVDFILKDVDPVRVGRKAMAVNLSDLAAMAARPTAAVVSVALPQGPGTRSLAQALFNGMNSFASEFNCPIAGGDTNTWAGPLVISVTAFGTPTGTGPVLRSGAQPGDWLFVTGRLGGSLRGHHFDFNPRIQEAIHLNESVRLKAMIDLSDGLASDVHHILDESQCGAVIDALSVPVNDGVTLENALADGEDFELLFAVSAEDGQGLLRQSPVPVWKIGQCVQDGCWLNREGVRMPLPRRGWVHAFS
jgi:thiamine-monophosphate kinase